MSRQKTVEPSLRDKIKTYKRSLYGEEVKVFNEAYNDDAVSMQKAFVAARSAVEKFRKDHPTSEKE